MSRSRDLFSVQVEIDFHGDRDSDGFAVFPRWLESPGSHRLHSFRIQATSQWAQDVNARRVSVPVNDQPKGYGSLVLRQARGFAEFWFMLEDCSWRTNAVSGFKQGDV